MSHSVASTSPAPVSPVSEHEENKQTWPEQSNPSNAQLTAQDQLIDIMASHRTYQANAQWNMQAFQQQIIQFWDQMIQIHHSQCRLQDIIMDVVLMVSNFIQLLLAHIMNRLGMKHMEGASNEDMKLAAPLILKEAKDLLDMIKDFRMTKINELNHNLDMYYHDSKAFGDIYDQQQGPPPMSEKKKGKLPAKPPRSKKKNGKQPIMRPSSNFSMSQSSKMPTTQQKLKEHLRQQLEPLPAEERVMAILDLPLKAIDILLSQHDDQNFSDGNSSQQPSTMTQT